MSEIIPDKIRFDMALDIFRMKSHSRFNIGTYKEKTVHMVLKYYLCPDEAKHEIKVGTNICDIVTDDGIYEIQTGNFDKMRGKLEALLPDNRVTIVYPVVYEKYLSWIDPESSEITSRRKTAKKGRVNEVLWELYKINPFLTDPNLSILVILINAEEFKLLNGYGKDKKLRASKYDRIPTAIVSETLLNDCRSYGTLIPKELPETFTVKEYAKAAHIRMGQVSRSFSVLRNIGAVKDAGKRGRANLYERTSELYDI